MQTRNLLLVAAVAALAWPSIGQAESTPEQVMARRIATEIRESGQLSNYRVGVKFDSGTAWLLGSVTDPDQAARAISLASRVKGVKRVINKLEVGGSEMAAASKRSPKIETPKDSSEEDGDSGLLLSLSEEEEESTDGELAAYEPPQLPAPRQTVRRVAQRTPQAGRRGMPTPFARTGPAPVQQASHRNVRPAQYGGPAAPGYVPAGGAGGVQGVNYENPNMPGYAWPSYASHPNYSAVSYPRQYSPTAWPYIGPFYPYPQVPLGWRKVALEWDDGWWFLDFSHHQRH